MSTINKSLMGFMFSGSALNLAGAAWKGNVNTIIGFNAAGSGYISFKPTSNFNSLTQLVQDGVYIVDAKTPGFDILGALLVATSSSAPVVSKLVIVSVAGRDTGSDTEVSFTVVNATYNAAPTNAYLAFVDDFQNNAFSGVNANGDNYLYFSPKLTAGLHRLTVIDSNGGVTTQNFTV